MLSLVALTLEHVPVGHVGDGEEVRRDLVPPLAQVDLDRRQRVDRVPLVRVHRHAEQAGVGLQHQNAGNAQDHWDFFEISLCRHLRRSFWTGSAT